jgi:quinol monooxygenase YgiN
MVLTVLEATVSPDRTADLESAFRAAAAQVPPALVRSHLLCASSDRTRWRIETLWQSRAALEAYRQTTATPAGLLMFRAAGAEPTLSVFDVSATIEAPPD